MPLNRADSQTTAASSQQGSNNNNNNAPNQNFIDRQKAKWKPDQLAVFCDRCNQPFGLLRRKHHCRRCGGIFCDPCCNTRFQLPGWGSEAQRVCKICEAILSSNGVTANALANNSSITSTNFLGSMMSKLASNLGGGNSSSNANNNNNTSSNNASPNARKPGSGNLEGLSGDTANKLPSLEAFPRERRILIIGSPGVGKGSFISTASRNDLSSSSQQQRTPVQQSGGKNNSNNNNKNDSSGMNNNAGFSSGMMNNNNNASSSANNNNNTNTNTNFEGFSLNEKRRNLSFNGSTYQLVLVNTAGSTVSSELFVHPLLTIGTSAYILMYDVTEPKSFEVLPLLHERLLDCGVHDKAKILVGSKADHVSSSGAGRERVVSKDMALRLANSWKAPHIDVSCTSKDSVDNALMELLREIAARDTY